MDAQTEIATLFAAQRSSDMLTKTELLEAVRTGGGQISDRTLTYYHSKHVVPAAIRIGSRGAAYPSALVEWVLLVLRARHRKVSVESLRQLRPLYLKLLDCRRRATFELAEIQRVARDEVELQEANTQVPWLLTEILERACSCCYPELLWVFKDGSEIFQGVNDQLDIQFLLAEFDESSNVGRPVAWTQLRLPGIGQSGADSHTTLVLGIPNGVEVEPISVARQYCADHVNNDSTAAPNREEALAS